MPNSPGIGLTAQLVNMRTGQVVGVRNLSPGEAGIRRSIKSTGQPVLISQKVLGSKTDLSQISGEGGAGEMAPQLGAPVALAENLGLFPTPYGGFPPSISPVPVDLMHSSGLCAADMHRVHIY